MSHNTYIQQHKAEKQSALTNERQSLTSLSHLDYSRRVEAVLPDTWSCAGFQSQLQEAEVVVFEFVTTEGLKPKHKV